MKSLRYARKAALLYARLAALLGSLLLVLLCQRGLAQPVDYVGLPALQGFQPHQSQVLDLTWAGERLFAVGERGLIAYTDDYGANWQQARVPVGQTLTAIDFPNEEQGWAVGHGGVILHSGDRGESWQLQFDGNSAAQQWLGYSQGRKAALEASLSSASGMEREDLEFELEEVVFEIEDTELALKSGPADPFLDVWFENESVGWAVGAYGLTFSTENGGLQWELAAGNIVNRERYHYYRIAGGEDGRMYLSGEAGIIYRSDNWGSDWKRLPLDYDGSLFGVIALEGDAVVCFGLRGNVFRSDDAGNNWIAVDPDPDPGLSLYGGARLEGGRLVLVGAGGGMAISNDQGRSFSSEVHSSRTTFSAVVDMGKDLLLGGMSGLVRIPAGAKR